MQRLNVFSNALTPVALILLFLCYWPTYIVPGLPVDALQKAHYVMVALFAVAICWLNGARLVMPKLAVLYLLPLLVYLLVFPQILAVTTFFHIGLILKVFTFSLFIVAVYSVLRKSFNVNNTPSLTRLFYLVLLLQLMFVALQLVFGDTTWLGWWNHKEVVTAWGKRAPGTFDWVYSTCYFLTFFIPMLLLNSVRSRYKFLNAILLGAVLIVVLLSQSKTGYLATVLVFAYLLLFMWCSGAKASGRVALLYLLMAVFLLLVLIYSGIELEYISNFIELISSGSTDGSTYTRLHQTKLAVGEGLAYWYQGSPDVLRGVVIENAYLDYLFRYGIWGLMQYLVFIGLLVLISGVVAYKAVQQANAALIPNQTALIALCCHISMVALSIYSLSAATADAYKSSMWTCFVFTLTIFVYHYSLKPTQALTERSANSQIAGT
ncbi:hypothetical protein [Rheinheimera maricola]|uniref:O-antigen ligase domain-containing protein n=1 Tax=Rheinheimera maricola TaxID=2793282 RepID=A0ABS7X4R5_9GAMM|nr:hypothetical protein [Rheinheimera maricola]MBZ9610296.1 hypothetical protein [Rheinheimera maricola]